MLLSQSDLGFPFPFARFCRPFEQCDDDREGNPGGWLEVIDAASCLLLYFFFLAPFFEDESAALM